MRVTRLLRRRLGSHPVALSTIVLSVVTAMLVVCSLQLLVGRVVDAGVGNVLAADVAQRSVAVRASVSDDDAAGVDALVRPRLEKVGRDTTVSKVAVATVRGIEGRAPTDRAQLAQADGLERAGELVAGRWPVRADSGSSGATRDVALPEAAAKALRLEVDDVIGLPDLVSPHSAPMRVRVSGVFRIGRPGDATWTDLPLAAEGVNRGIDYTTYGPFLLADGDTAGLGGMNVVWRAVPQLGGLGADALDQQRKRVAQVVGSVARSIGGSVDGGPVELAPAARAVDNASVESGLGPLLERASSLSTRIDAALLTPAVLLVLLGLVALVVAAQLLADLRAPENQLLRIRGASTRQLAWMSGVEATVIATLGAVVALVLAPLVVRLINDADRSYAGEVWSARSVAAATLLAVLAVVVMVATTTRHGHVHGVDRSGRSVGRGLRLLASSGLDLVVLAVGGLAAVQLHRYAASAGSTIDPLTIAAPALVIAGLALLALRLLPVITGRIAAITSRSRRLAVTWSGWQLARRLAEQGGTILLVLMAVAMGDLALAHSATSARMFDDQEAARVGAPVRVDQDYLRTRPVFAGSIYDRAAGDPDRVNPVWRSSFDLGGVTGIDLLAMDASTAGRVVRPRPDMLLGQDWARMMRDLARARVLPDGIKVPGEPRKLTVVASVTGRTPRVTAPAPVPAALLVRDGRGLVSALPLGNLGTRPSTHDVSLTETGRSVTWPLSVIGLSASTPSEESSSLAPGAGIELAEVAADGQPLHGLDRLRIHDSPQGPVLGLAPVAGPVRAVLTRAVARAGRADVGDTVRLDLPGGQLDVFVGAIVDTIPTARSPHLAVVTDLPSVQARISGVDLDPNEWWLAPEKPEAALRALRQDPALVGQVLGLDEAIAARVDDPVNEGMHASMWLVTAAALVLAALGFAAATAALRGTRRRDNVVLLALGMPWSGLRAVMVWERVLVVATAVFAGSMIAWASAVVIIPALVGSDGVEPIPPVQLDIPSGAILGMALTVLVLLSAVAVAVLGRRSGDLAGDLRRVQP